MPAASCRHEPECATGWRARLELRYRRDRGRTIASRRHAGPLVVQRSLYPEGAAVCQNVIVHPPGGIVGGDALAIAVDVETGAHAQLTTPGAAKWYRTAGDWAQQTVSLRVEGSACLEWLPQESIVFDAARARQDTLIRLTDSSRYIGWDLFCLGRTASGERFRSGTLVAGTTLVVDDEPAWVECARVDGGSAAATSPVGLAGAPVFGTLLASGPGLERALLDAARAIAPSEGEGVVTLLPGLLAARYRGSSAEAAREWLRVLWRLLRPVVVGLPAVPPRIWST